MPEHSGPMRLLVAESDPLVRQWLGLQAEDLGVQIFFAASSGEALEAISAESPDCVVLDARSSADSEAPLWNRIRQAPESQHIPVLLYSSSDRWQRVAELAGAQMDGFIDRPFTTETLLHAARRASSRRARSRRASSCRAAQA